MTTNASFITSPLSLPFTSDLSLLTSLCYFNSIWPCSCSCMIYPSSFIPSATEMGIRCVLQGSWRCNYRRLISAGENAKTQRRWLRRIDGKVFGLRLKSSKRLKWRCFSSVLMQRKIAEICSDMKKKVKLNGAIVPTIFFPSQWGIPILSNPSEFHRKQSIYF
ncbi:uncharacterized protein LOC110035183 [Phalaenopsis equestris]|uniref:uncharacterized protein LOC110035183 n=1 Tax=Phalaenopsis equestris TaxID=78828 RepID=UPI0009E5D950|nr:uncharacterized protein LOC110035183 [Phalaenopsis equestris]